MKDCKCKIDKNDRLIMCPPCAEEDAVIARQWAEDHRRTQAEFDVMVDRHSLKNK